MIIHGITQARDEWPLLGLAVSHALVHHVDRVHVVLHGADHASAAGLRVLQETWGDRLRVLTRGGDNFDQAATTNMAIELAEPEAGDWVYVFDADEFLLASQPSGLRAILGACDPAIAAIRYQVLNWPSLRTFDVSHPEDFLRLRWRSCPSGLVTLPPDLMRHEIRAGNLSFFDVPFPSKVIMRASGSSWLNAGAHSVTDVEPLREAEVDPTHLVAAHVPLLDRARLTRCVAQGRRHITYGYPRDHGWQNQLVAELDDWGELDDFWAAHTIDEDTQEVGCAVEVDDSLRSALLATLQGGGESLSRAWSAPGETCEGQAAPPVETTVSVAQAVRVVRRREALDGADRASAAAREQALRHEVGLLCAERDQLRDDGDQLRDDRHQLRVERVILEKTVEAREALVASLVAQRDLRDRTLATIFASRSWRFTEWMRRLWRG